MLPSFVQTSENRWDKDNAKMSNEEEISLENAKSQATTVPFSRLAVICM